MCNVYLHRLDRDWDTRTYGVLVRFADDLLVVCKSRQQAQAALARLRELLADLGLAPKEAKTRIVHLQHGGEGFDFSDPQAGDPPVGAAAERAPGSPAELVRQAEADAGERHDRPSTHMLAENARLAPGERRAAAGQQGPARGERVFRQRDRPDPEVVMSFIDAHGFPAGLVLRVLDVRESTYYDWRARQVSPSRREDAALLEQIVKVRSVNEFAATYGSPRVWLELRRQGVRVGRKRVERLMREHGLQGAFLRGWRHGSTRQNPNHTPAPDRVNRDFTAAAPDRLWVADATRIPCAEGSFWMAGGPRRVLQPDRRLEDR